MTVLAVFIGGFGLECYGINISDDLEKGLRSSEKQKQHDYRTHATAEFEVSCGLRLVVGSRPNLLLLMILNARMRDYFAENGIQTAWFEFWYFCPTG